MPSSRRPTTPEVGPVTDASRRAFLGAAAALTALPAAGAGDVAAQTDVEEPATQECDVCGGEKPAEMVERTTVAPIDPMEADICRACQHVQDHELEDGRCIQCGDDLSSEFYIEVHFELGPAELPGMIAGQLCGDCAGWVACDITYDGVRADDEAYEEHIEILDEETQRLKEIENAADTKERDGDA